MSLSFAHLSARFAAPVAAALLRDKTFANDTPSREKTAKEIEAGQHSELAASLFKQFAGATDPTADRVNGKPYLYLNFIVQSYLKKNVMAEDFYKIKADLHDLSIWGARLERSDIRQYKDLADLADALRPLQQQRDKKKAQEEDRKLPPEQRARLMRETTVVYDGLEGKIVMPHTKESCQYWGSNTKWCIAATENNAFEGYNKESPILICLPRISPQMQKDNESYSSFKFAFVARDLWDETDEKTNTPPYLRPLVTAATNKAANPVTRDWLAHYLSVANPPAPAPARHPDYDAWSAEKRKWYDNVTQDGLLLEYAPASLKHDRNIVLAAIAQNGWALYLAADSLRRDSSIMLTAATQCGRVLKYADDSLRRDRKIVLAAVMQNGWALAFADDSLKRDRKIVVAAVMQNGAALQYAPDGLKRDRKIALAAVTQNGAALEYVPASLKRDREIVLAAVTQNGQALCYADASLKNDRAFMLAAVTQDGQALKHAPASLKRDREIVLAAVTQDGRALYYAANSLRRDPAFLRAILHACPQAFFQMEEEDKRIILHLAGGEDGLHRALIDAGARWNDTHPGRETENPCTPHLRHMPQLWGDIAAITDPKAAQKALLRKIGNNCNPAAVTLK